MNSSSNSQQTARVTASDVRNPFRAAEREASVRSRTKASAERYARACAALAGGVSSGLRRSARPYPMYYESGHGPRVRDVDGNQFVDYALAWGPLILGHSPPEIADAIATQVRRGLTYGAQHDLEIEVAERLKAIIPCADAVAFANSGTDIVQLALRLARAVTGRRKHIKFTGHYHGWDDSVLVSYHPTRQQLEEAGGQPVGVGQGQLPPDCVVIADWNDRDSVDRAFADNPAKIASIICEPLVCNSSCLPPEDGFLEFLREAATSHGVLLIFDEVITGFRLALGGAQEYYGVTPDLATYAKAVGAGTPLSVLAGRAEYMDLIAKGQVVHAGSLNGNPVCLAAAKAALSVLARDDGSVYRALHRRGDQLRTALESLLRTAGLPAVTNGAGPVFHVSFADRAPKTYVDTLAADTALYSDFALALLDEGILVLPDGRWYLSVVHGDGDVEDTIDAARRTLQ